VFADRQRNLYMVFEKVGHNAGDSNVAFILRMVPHMRNPINVNSPGMIVPSSCDDFAGDRQTRRGLAS
jgi:hypothetical protein